MNSARFQHTATGSKELPQVSTQPSWGTEKLTLKNSQAHPPESEWPYHRTAPQQAHRGKYVKCSSRFKPQRCFKPTPMNSQLLQQQSHAGEVHQGSGQQANVAAAESGLSTGEQSASPQRRDAACHVDVEMKGQFKVAKASPCRCSDQNCGII